MSAASPALTRWKRRLPGFLMSAPAVIVFLVLFIVPMVFSFVLSLTNWTGYSLNFDFIGFQNYLNAFKNARTIDAAIFTAILAVVGTILCNVFGLGLASLVSAPGAMNTVARTVFFYPSVISALIIGFLWSALLAPQGAINGLLEKFGLGAVPFLTDPAFAKGAVIFTVVWSHFGFNMILYIAGLKSIPPEYYEAATVDGADTWTRFRHITLPLLAPIVTVNIVLTLVGLLRVYDIVLAITDGGPAASTETIVYQILRDSFLNAKLGFGAAQSFMLLIVTAIFGIAVTLARRGAEKKVSE